MAIYYCRGREHLDEVTGEPMCDYQADRPWKGYYIDKGKITERFIRGRCPKCKKPYSVMQVGVESSAQKRSTLAQLAERPKIEHIATGMAEFDRLLNGGFVPTFVHLFGGYPNAGKTTFLLKLVDVFSRKRKALWASSEQTEDGIMTFAQRLGADSQDVVILGKQQVIEETLDVVRRERPFLVVYDSLQKYRSVACAGPPGSASQGTAVSRAITEDCQSSKRCAIIINQMSRSGTLKGGLDVEHDVDVVMVLGFPKDDDENVPEPDDDAEPQIRVLVVEKNRDGEADLKSYWQMKASGMEHVKARSKITSIRGRYGKG